MSEVIQGTSVDEENALGELVRGLDLGFNSDRSDAGGWDEFHTYDAQYIKYGKTIVVSTTKIGGLFDDGIHMMEQSSISVHEPADPVPKHYYNLESALKTVDSGSPKWVLMRASYAYDRGDAEEKVAHEVLSRVKYGDLMLLLGALTINDRIPGVA